jgi:uncharacterized protein YdhG (YjbR/CyaY superfamily)
MKTKIKYQVTKKRIFENNSFLITFLITENKYKISPKNSFNDIYFDDLQDAMNYIKKT